MTGRELEYARRKMGLSRTQLGDLLGYASDDPKLGHNNVRRMETGKRDVSPMCARLVIMIYRHWASTGNLPEFGDAGVREA